MKNTYFQANLVSVNRINVLLFTSIILPNNAVFYLEKDNEPEAKMKILRHISNNAVNIYELEMPHNFEYGHKYVVVLEGFPRINVDVSEATNFPGFDEKFYYEGKDLGAIYTKEETKFNVWAPLASEVVLKVEEKGQFVLYHMQRTDKGVYRLSLKGDYLNARYHYLVTNSGITAESNDPWGKGTSFNSEYSAVVDIESLKKIKHIKPDFQFDEYSEAVVYETCIRDFTEDKNTDIVNKGKFLGLVEEGRKTKRGHPAGLDHLKKLGITHLQILPVIDFFGNDDADPKKSYNWGYNPITFFALEGSYSTKPNEPMNRLIEFKTMVEQLHKNNIRVIMDVVYNHLYEWMYTSFEKVVPNYFYRKRPNGLQACASGCGDDFASEKLMARKAILESLEYFTEIFDIDGYRFDLMGLLDIETINRGYEICKNIKSDIIMYGEAWNMGAELPLAQKACFENSNKIPHVGCFNDLYRDAMRGGCFKDNLSDKGYVSGNLVGQDVINHLIRGSTVDTSMKRHFSDKNQSLNYVECHDNNTLFDKLSICSPNEDDAILLKRVEFANRLVMLSLGIPFIHMGQEIGQSKSGLDNTYNVPKVNNMDWKLIDERYEMVEHLSKSIALRKCVFNFFKENKIKDFEKIFKTQYWNNGILCFYYENDKPIGDIKKAAILINPTLEKKTYELDDYYQLFLVANNKGETINMKNGIIPPLSIQILYVKEE